MTERTALFLASLSHQYFLLVLPLPIIAGIATYYAGAFHKRARAGTSAEARWGGIALQTGSRVLLAASIAVFLVAFFHVGCATIKAHSVQCMSNIKVLAAGALMYSEDYDEHLPPTTRWAEAIEPRVRQSAGVPMDADHNPFRCPAAESPGSYGMNAALDSLAQTKIDAPSNTVLLFDADAPRRSFSGGAQEVASSRHGGTPNIAFEDGHAKWANAYVRAELNWAPTVAHAQRSTVPVNRLPAFASLQSK